jgi:hypothetical protein
MGRRGSLRAMTGIGVRRWIAVLPALVIALATMAACSSGGSTTAAGTASGSTRPASSGSGSASGQGGQFGAAFQAYTSCLTKNGVTLPSRSPGVRPSDFPSGARPSGSRSRGARPSGAPSGGFRGGFGGFGTTPPAGVDPSTWAKAMAACASVRPSFSTGPGRSGGAVDATAFAAYVSCLSDHGVKVSGTGFAALRSLNRAAPAVAKALKTCAPLLPAGVRGGAAPSPSPSSS